MSDSETFRNSKPTSSLGPFLPTIPQNRLPVGLFIRVVPQLQPIIGPYPVLAVQIELASAMIRQIERHIDGVLALSAVWICGLCSERFEISSPDLELAYTGCIKYPWEEHDCPKNRG